MKPEKLLSHLGNRPALICIQAMEDMPEDMKPAEMETQEGVAIIPICGILGNDPERCNCTYAGIQANISKALSDPSVRGIIFNVNSPGGYTDGVFETGLAIQKAAAQKPCWSVANPIAYSGAYWLASQTQRIYVPPVSGGVGSIGVYTAHVNMSGFLSQMGIEMTLISAGKGKTDGNPYEPLTPEAKAKLQADVNRLYGEFVGAVSRGRNMAAQDVIALGAELCDGSKRAIGSGLADASGDLATAWVDLVSSLDRKPMMSVPSAAASVAAPIQQEVSMGDTAQTPADAVQPAPAAAAQAEPVAAPTPTTEELVAQAQAAGYGAAAEIVELCAIAGKPALASKFIGQKFSRAQAGAELLKIRAAESGPETASHILPDSGTSTEAKPSDSPVVKACEARAAAAKGGK